MTRELPDSQKDSREPSIWLVEQQRGGRLQWFLGYPPELREVRGYQIPKKLREGLEKFRQDRQSIGALSLGWDVAWIEWWDRHERHHEFQLYSGEPFYFVKAARNGEERFYQIPRPWPKSDQRPDLLWRRDWQKAQQLMMVRSEHSGNWRAPHLSWTHLLDQRELARLPMDRLGTDYVPLLAHVIRSVPPTWKIEHTLRHTEDGQEQQRLPQVYVSRRPWFMKSTSHNGRVAYHQIHPSYTRGAGH